MRLAIIAAFAAGAAVTLGAAPARAGDLEFSGKLLLTQGASTIEGSAGGGLATWAVITGYEAKDGVGANVHATYVDLNDFTLQDYGASIGFFDRVELSYAHEAFDTGATGAKLGLGRGFTFDQDIVGAKVRLFGDAVFDQDSWLPQVAVGAQYKSNDQDAVLHAVGAKSSSGIDYYLAATKVLLDQSLVIDATLRATRANQTGLLGFGGDKNSGYSAEFEGSLAYLVTRHLAVGGELRTKPDNLSFAREDNWWDLFAAYAVSKSLSVTLAYADLGDIATFKNQRGLYLSLQAGF
jgi:hypothetical protein